MGFCFISHHFIILLSMPTNITSALPCWRYKIPRNSNTRNIVPRTRLLSRYLELNEEYFRVSNGILYYLITALTSLIYVCEGWLKSFVTCIGLGLEH